MRKTIAFLMLVVMLFAFNQIYAQFDNPGVGLGIAVGGAEGDNSSADKWVMQGRGYFQYKLISPVLLGQLSVGYTELNAPGVYNTKTIMVDNRFLFIPFSLEKLNPFLYGGIGVSKDISASGSDFLPMIPMGVGIQTRLGSQMLLEVSGGYNLALSDKLDGRQRSDSDLNSLTNKKHDGYFGFNIGLMFTRGSDATTDSDKDGLSNQIEKELGTDPKKVDTDSDGLNDGAEVNQYKTDPLKTDSDADGLNDGDEVNQHKTYPLKTDSDGDGLNDGVEVNQYKADPLKADSDSDGLNDGAEVNQYKTNPLKADSDADGLNDGAEVNQYKADPLKADTDGDGLKDGAEANQYKTDPAKADTDGDGLSDGDEVNKYKTDPVKIDTDGGSANDGAEVKNKTNPLDSKDDIAKPTTTIILEKGKKVILRGVNFETNRATLTADSRYILEEAYKALVANSDVQVEISGHTDSMGSDAYNQDLSLRRAQAVRNWLVQKGIAGNRLKTVGKGEKEPVASNDTKEGRAENRRIEFYVQQ
ncbi:OmpA family protein [candidate division KSB1 bacterium]|nr:OmpA family protein [candidate division KSB1 bacterium]